MSANLQDKKEPQIFHLEIYGEYISIAQNYMVKMADLP